MAYLELILLVTAVATLVVIAQRSRLKPREINILREVGEARGLQVEAGVGTASLAGIIDERRIRVHAIMDGWAVTISGAFDPAAAAQAAPGAQIGAGKLQVLTTLEVAAMTAAIDLAVRATRT